MIEPERSNRYHMVDRKGFPQWMADGILDCIYDLQEKVPENGNIVCSKLILGNGLTPSPD